jgi:hypothetical protein
MALLGTSCSRLINLGATRLILYRSTPNPMSPGRSDFSTPSKNGLGDGRRLLQLGHDGMSGFTSQAFKMHEWIR